MLHLKKIKKSYTTGDFTQTALNGIDLSFRPQEFVAILGQSGSGKTTALNIIGGLDQYDNGDLIISGRSTKNFSESDWDAYRNNSVGFVFQSYNLIPHLSILNNVEMGMTLSGVSANEKRSKALNTLERVGLKDHTHKKPTQLSGGQMQRVAIARALANDPDIILADEPTGALDSTTSGQILDLIKEIADDKLVIMVTHNAVLANKYADRIVEFKDGEIINDSNPYATQVIAESGYSLKRTAMNYFTALKLSGKNIATKKWRTALTAFASSIGIIGIALIMSLSNGLQDHIDEFEENALIEMPILVMRDAMDFGDDFMEGMQERQAELEAFRHTDEPTIFLFNLDEDSPIHRNIISQDFIDYVLALDPEIIRNVSFNRATGMNLLRMIDDEVISVNLESSQVGMMGMMASGSSVFLETLNPDESSHLEQNYDLLAGTWPTYYTDAVVIVDVFNRMNLSVLEALGFDTYELDTINFDEVVGIEMQLVANDDFYIQTELGNFMPNPDLEEVYDSNNHQTITITGVFRLQEDVFNDFEVLNPGIIYSDELLRQVIEREQESEIVLAQLDADYHVLTLEAITDEEKDRLITFLGGDSEPFIMAIIPRDFDAKDTLIDYLDAFNETLEDTYRIVYTDQAEIITNLLGNMLLTVTYVLVGFAAISLVVSLIMIAIITYISVMERTKEIGILRALGARKKDITRVFNAETFIIGMCSGILAITVSYLLTIPINNIIYGMTQMESVANLNPLHALVLLLLSLTLTVLGGLIPACLAAKKDPVAALRAE